MFFLFFNFEKVTIYCVSTYFFLSLQYYQAIYPFIARNDLEVSLTEGHYVKVIEKHDLDGNDEWWLVEVEGHQGYAPANYIEKV